MHWEQHADSWQLRSVCLGSLHIGLISKLEKVIVIIFQICSLLVLERPIPFALGLLTGSGLLGGTLESSWLQRLLSLPVWLIGLVGILVFDALRLDPHSFQMLLHSRQSLVIVIWLLALLLLLKGVQGNQAGLIQSLTMGWAEDSAWPSPAGP